MLAAASSFAQAPAQPEGANAAAETVAAASVADAAATSAAATADATPDATVDDSTLIAVAVGLVLVPLLIWVVRRSLVRHIRGAMMVDSAEQPAVIVDELQGGEVDARAQPTLRVDDADHAAAEGSPRRRQLEQAALGLLRRVCLADLGIACGYAALPLIGGLLQWTESGALGLTLAAGVAIFTLVRYALHRRQFRAFNLRRSRQRQRVYRSLAWVGRGVLFVVTMATGATVSNVLYLPDVLRGIFGTWMRTVLSAIVVAVVTVIALIRVVTEPDWPSRGAAVGLLVATALHAGVFAALARRFTKTSGPRVLILRVFDIEATSSFVFSGLMRYWRHFGNHFTVVDAALVRQNYAHREWQTGFLVIGGYAALAASTALVMWILRSRLGYEMASTSMAVTVLVLGVAAAWAAWSLGRRRIDGRFTRSLDQLLARLRRVDAHPRHLDLTFRPVQALCHNNTWFPAVAEFSRRADVVLMDLRGYSEARQGCQHEVDFLFDAVPVERLLFLVEPGCEAAVQQMLFSRWRMLRTTSPNLARPEPAIGLFRVRDNDERDMQAILDRLADIAAVAS